MCQLLSLSLCNEGDGFVILGTQKVTTNSSCPLVYSVCDELYFWFSSNH